MAKDKPLDGQYKRKGERDGPKITPAERALNWVKVCAAVVALIGVGAGGNSEAVKNVFTASTLTTEETIGASAVEAKNYDVVIKQLIAANEKRKAEIKVLQSIRASTDTNLKARIDRWHGTE